MTVQLVPMRRMDGSTRPAVLDDELRKILENLAEGMFPLSAWIAERVRTETYKREAVPWHESRKSPSVKDTGVVQFFIELLEESEEEVSRARRFADVIHDPLAYSPLEGVREWRAARKLGPAEFGIVASGNTIATVDGRPVTRAEFYAPYWPLLGQAVRDAAPKTAGDWEALARDLMKDGSPQWPAQPLKAQPFMKQLGRDLLHGLLNMRNPAADPCRVAFLEELGEHRRVGNAFTRHDAEVFVRAFMDQIGAP